MRKAKILIPAAIYRVFRNLKGIADGKMESPGTFVRFGVELVSIGQTDCADWCDVPETDSR